MNDTSLSSCIAWIKQNFAPDAELLVSREQFKERIKTVPAAPIVPASVERLPSPRISKVPLPEKSGRIPDQPPPAREAPPPKNPTLSSKDLIPFRELTATVEKLFPGFPLKEIPPRDESAFSMADPSFMKGLQSKIVIFSFAEDQKSELFLRNLALAIETYLSPPFLFSVPGEQEKRVRLFLEKTEAKLVIASRLLIEQSIFLPFVRENPASSERFLGKGRLVLLEPFPLYFTASEKKKALWHTLCTLFKQHSTQE